MAGFGNTQIIGGKSYTQYTPEWYSAMDAQKIHDAGVSGTAQGTGAGNAATTYLGDLQKTGLPLLGSSSGTSAGARVGATGVGGGGTPFPTVGSPSLSGLNASVGFSGGPTGSGGGGTPSIAPVDTSAAENAAFDQAKDRVGQVSSGALTGLRSALGGRGMLGSGAESRGTASVVNAGVGQLGDTARTLAIDKADKAQQNALASYNGGVTMRGQDINSATSLANTGFEGQVTQRGQDINQQIEEERIRLAQSNATIAQQQQALQGLLGALGPFAGGAY